MTLRRPRAGVTLAAVLFAVGLTACGGGDSTGDAGGAEAMTVQGAETAVTEILSSTDPAVCGRMTDAYIQALYFKSGAAGIHACEQKVAENPLTDLSVAGVSVDGETATGTVSTVLGSAQFSAVYADGQWKLDTFKPVGQ